MELQRRRCVGVAERLPARMRGTGPGLAAKRVVILASMGRVCERKSNDERVSVTDRRLQNKSVLTWE